MKYISVFFLTACFVLSCTSQKTIVLTGKAKLKFSGEYDIPHNKVFQNTTIGGLSGIDYDRRSDIYYLICDDRSDINPARFYSVKIHLNEKGIDSVQFLSVKDLLQPNGQVYPNFRHDAFHVPDPEAIRYNARTKQLVWSSEGERLIRKDTNVLIDPFVRIMDTAGNYMDSFQLPRNMHIKATENGPRRNGVFEGLSFANDYRTLYVSVEEPLYEDGPKAGLNDSSAWIRIIKYDVNTKTPVAQYGYRIDPVAYPPSPASAFKINGVPDILAISDHQLLVLERSFSSGRKPCTIKIYLAELNGAEDISSVTSLNKTSFRAVQKKLLLNMDSLGIYTDNVEGMTFGPRLPNGHQTLIFVADNNFSADEITQFLLFEIE